MPTDFVPRLPKMPSASGPASVSMALIVIVSSGTPIASAAIMRQVVRWPPPMSEAPVFTTMEPSPWIWTMPVIGGEFAPLLHSKHIIPMPRSGWSPTVALLQPFQRSAQPKSSAPRSMASFSALLE